MFCCFPCCDAHTFGSWSSSHLLLLPHWSAHIPLTAHIPLFLSPPPTFPSPLSVLSLHLALHSLLFFILFPYSTPLFHLFMMSLPPTPLICQTSPSSVSIYLSLARLCPPPSLFSSFLPPTQSAERSRPKPLSVIADCPLQPSKVLSLYVAEWTG